jgi:hypothetical protein
MAASSPQLLDQPLPRHDHVPLQQQRAEQRALLRSTELDHPILVAHLDRPQDAELHTAVVMLSIRTCERSARRGADSVRDANNDDEVSPQQRRAEASVAAQPVRANRDRNESSPLASRSLSCPRPAPPLCRFARSDLHANGDALARSHRLFTSSTSVSLSARHDEATRATLIT